MVAALAPLHVSAGRADAAVAPAVPPPSNVVFAPGTWRGRAVGTGAIHTEPADGLISKPFIIDFEFVVGVDGSVQGLWLWSGEVTVATDVSSGVFAMEGSGELAGSPAVVDLTGVIHVAGSVTTQGQTIEIAHDEQAEASFWPTWTSCTLATGDLATVGRGLQQSAGVGTTVRAPFAARMISPPDEDSSLEATYSDLVLAAESLLAGNPPAGADFLDLVVRVEAWHNNLLRAARCGGATPNLMPGTHPHTYLIELLGALVIAAMGNPSVYMAADVQMIAGAALRIGLLGAAAPNSELAEDVAAALLAALEAKLADAESNDDEDACMVVAITATTLGLTTLATQAQQCA